MPANAIAAQNERMVFMISPKTEVVGSASPRHSLQSNRFAGNTIRASGFECVFENHHAHESPLVVLMRRSNRVTSWFKTDWPYFLRLADELISFLSTGMFTSERCLI